MTRGLEKYLYVFYAGLHPISSSARLAATVSMIVFIEIFPVCHFPFLGLGTLAVKMRAKSVVVFVFLLINIAKANIIE